MSKSAVYEIDMCEGKILGKLLKFSLPLMLSSIMQLLFNAADVIVVGRFAGDTSLAAVGSTGSLVSLITNLFIGLSVGANVVAARMKGAGDEKGMRETVHTSMLISVISGLVLTAIGFFFAEKFLGLMGTPPDVIGLATAYLRIYFLGMTSMMLYNFGAAILRAVGDTRRPLYFLFIAGVVNVALNLVFVIVFKMGVAGVAIATIISQTISAVLIVICLIRSDGAMRLDLRALRIHRHILAKIARIGLPAGVQGMMFSISNVIIQSTVNTYGSTIMAGNSAAGNIEGFVYVAMNSVAQGVMSFAGQNCGARRYDRLWRIAGAGFFCECVAGILLGVTAWHFGEPLLSMYSEEAAVIAAGRIRLSYLCLPYAICGIMDLMAYMLRGMGWSITPMIVSLMGACVLRIIWVSTICQMPQFAEIKFLYMSYPISWAVTFIAHAVCFLLAMRRLNVRGRVAHA